MGTVSERFTSITFSEAFLRACPIDFLPNETIYAITIYSITTIYMLHFTTYRLVGITSHVYISKGVYKSKGAWFAITELNDQEFSYGGMQLQV